MIEVRHNRLVIQFPELEETLRQGFDGELARLSGGRTQNRKLPAGEIKSLREELTSTRITVDFQRTLRIPDDGKEYPLPPGLGRFPIEHVDDHKERLPEAWIRHGGVLVPMYQREALWLNFSGQYPTALKVATGKVCCVTGEPWSDGLSGDLQNFLALPEQPWLDGYVVAKGIIRQFVAAPIGKGATVEEQLTGEAKWNGMQLQAFPMKPETYVSEILVPQLEEKLRSGHYVCCLGEAGGVACEMGLGAGGRMKQEIYFDQYGVDAYSTKMTSRCFVHFLNAMQWQAVTGRPQPATPVTVESYMEAGLPWFLHYSEQPGVEATRKLSGIKSVDTVMGPPPATGTSLDGEW